MRAKLVKESLNILKPKSKEDIISYLNKLTKEEKDKKLIEASYNGNIEIVKLLIETGADINAKNNYGSTSLMYASKIGHKKIVLLLIEAGADINAKNNYGYTVLMFATANNYKDIVALLKKYGAKE